MRNSAQITRLLKMGLLPLFLLNLFCAVVVIAELDQSSDKRATCGNDNESVLNMDVEWVMHCATFSFTGFFVEFLGISKSLRKLLPQSRLVQSMFRYSFEESALQNEVAGYNTDSKFLDGLFPIEKEIIFEMYSTEQEALGQGKYYDHDKSISTNNARPVPVFYKSPDVDQSAVCHQGGQNFEMNTAYIGGALGRYRASFAQTPRECCEACFRQPLCTMWTYDSTADGNGEGCSLHGSKPRLELGSQIGAVSGKMTHRPSANSPPNTPVPRRMTAPKAIIFHSTACVYRNESAQLNRNIDTIMIGRYMLERSELHSGLSLDEYSVSMCLQFMDELWVPTEWHRYVFQNLMKQHGIRAPAIAVIPEAIDTTLFDPALVPNSESVMTSRGGGCVIDESSGRVKCQNSSAFQFLSIFKWEYRKGWDVLLKAYLSTFTDEDDVVLRLRTYVPSFDKSTDPNITKTINNFMIKNSISSEGTPRIVWENGVVNSEGVSTSDSLTRAEIRDLLGTVDAFVLPTRGEGWGLPIAEAMAMELPVIVTNYSGPTAFINEDNAYLIPVLPQRDADSFAQPDEGVLKVLLKQVIKDYSSYTGTSHEQQQQQHSVEVSAAEGSAMARESPIASSSSSFSSITKDATLSVAVRKGRAARITMKEFSPDSVVCAINTRLRELAKFRGWNFP